MAFTIEALMVAAVALVVIYVSRVLFKQQNLNRPPGPRPWPIIGSMHLLGTHPRRNLADLAQKYGPVMSLWLGQRLCVVATSPGAAKEFLKLQDANFSDRPPFRAVDVIAPEESLVFNDITPVFRHLRKILVSELTSAKQLKASKHIRTDEMAFMLRAIAKAAATGHPITVNTHLHTMSTNVLSRMILRKRFLGGGDPSQDASEIQEFIGITTEATVCLGSINLQDYFDFVPTWFDPQGLEARCRKIRARRDVFYANMIAQHKEDRRRNPISSDGDKTLLDVLLEQLDDPDLHITEAHVRGVVWDALAAGTGTTMQTSEWAMAEVLRNPVVVEKARLELDCVVGLDRMVQESDIPQLKYIQAVVKEVFRLHSTVPLLVPHQSINATKVFGYDIPAKTRLFVNVWGIGHDHHVWEQPLEFVPERFLDGGLHHTTEFQGQHFELIPFGTGRRACPGLVFGSLMVHLQVANLLHAFYWSFPDGVVLEKLDMMEGQGLTLPMQNPLVAIAKPRLPLHLY